MEVILSIIASVLELFNNVIEMIKALCGFSSVKEKQEVDLSKFQTFCIGYPSGAGCVAEYNQETGVLTMNYDLSAYLTENFGKGFSPENLKLM